MTFNPPEESLAMKNLRKENPAIDKAITDVTMKKVLSESAETLGGIFCVRVVEPDTTYRFGRFDEETATKRAAQMRKAGKDATVETWV